MEALTVRIHFMNYILYYSRTVQPKLVSIKYQNSTEATVIKKKTQSHDRNKHPFVWETFVCTFIQRFKSAQLISYNIETFISCFNTQTPRVSYSHQSQKAALFRYPEPEKQIKKNIFTLARVLNCRPLSFHCPSVHSLSNVNKCTGECVLVCVYTYVCDEMND